MTYSSFRRFLTLALALLAFDHGGAQAGVVRDGTVGPGGAIAPVGGDYAILAGFGTQMGGNLFHSFSQFNLVMGESATFSGPNSISNIFARVTGGVSSIDGAIKSNISGANLFLINPAGVLFGGHASVDVQGSFTVSTANYVKLGNNGRFDATTPSNTILTSDPVSAWGFLTDKPKGITPLDPLNVDDVARFNVAPGGTLSFIGGNVALNYGEFSAPGGRLELAAYSKAGEYSAVLNSTRGGGNIDLNHFQSSLTGGLDGFTGGSVCIRGGQLKMVNASRVAADTTGSGRGGDFDVRTGRKTVIKNNSGLLTSTSGGGRAGNVSIRAGRLRMEADGTTGSLATVTSTATAQAGRVSVHAGKFLIADGAKLVSSTNGAGRASVVAVDSGDLTIRGRITATLNDGTGIFADSSSSGAGGTGGDIHIHTDSLSITNCGQIASNTSGLGLGGNVDVVARNVFISAANVPLTLSGGGTPFQTGIFADTEFGGLGGRGGDVHVTADHIGIFDGGLISTKSRGQGGGGDTFIDAGVLEIARGSSGFFTGLAADSALPDLPSGRGGNVTVHADTVRVSDGGQISANTFGTGDGGSVLVEADEIELVGRPDLFTGISAESLSVGDGGRGGDVRVIADRLSITDGARISANTNGMGMGGSVLVQADDAFLSSAGSLSFTGISAETSLAAPGGGSGGDVRVEADRLTLTDRGAIAGTSNGSGAGGSVAVEASTLTLDGLSFIEASASGTGIAGSVSIDVINPLVLDGGSAVRTTSALTSAGTITVKSASDIELGGGSSVTVTATRGDAGLISFPPPVSSFCTTAPPSSPRRA
jgi:filamentous hemagglutinin family protein